MTCLCVYHLFAMACIRYYSYLLCATVRSRGFPCICYASKLASVHHIDNKSEQVEEAGFESYLLYCYTLVNINKNVCPISLQKHKPFLGLD